MTKTSNSTPDKRLDREVEREREQRHKNDEARAGILGDDDFRLKDARDSNSSGQLHRHRAQ
jgi:hypothetical protein